MTTPQNTWYTTSEHTIPILEEEENIPINLSVALLKMELYLLGGWILIGMVITLVAPCWGMLWFAVGWMAHPYVLGGLSILGLLAAAIGMGYPKTDKYPVLLLLIVHSLLITEAIAVLTAIHGQ